MSAVSDSMLSIIGQPQSRIDGPLKVTGRAQYTSDIDLPDMLYAVPVCAACVRPAVGVCDPRPVAESAPGPPAPD